ncbi:hypothetical protein EJ08DRAFT_298428 [Tothia fuscella]|uniref:Uncharacterized protein n=1 Tax=Tothia fuscella TaxID=1048955 RepID=A0A9P4NQ86_9PEZI|nr:hypothetical protein EJ08DRAFT_298428 [Tothia fuscella]
MCVECMQPCGGICSPTGDDVPNHPEDFKRGDIICHNFKYSIIYNRRSDPNQDNVDQYTVITLSDAHERNDGGFHMLLLRSMEVAQEMESRFNERNAVPTLYGVSRGEFPVPNGMDWAHPRDSGTLVSSADVVVKVGEVVKGSMDRLLDAIVGAAQNRWGPTQNRGDGSPGYENDGDSAGGSDINASPYRYDPRDYPSISELRELRRRGLASPRRRPYNRPPMFPMRRRGRSRSPPPRPMTYGMNASFDSNALPRRFRHGRSTSPLIDCDREGSLDGRDEDNAHGNPTYKLINYHGTVHWNTGSRAKLGYNQHESDNQICSQIGNDIGADGEEANLKNQIAHLREANVRLTESKNYWRAESELWRGRAEFMMRTKSRDLRSDGDRGAKSAAELLASKVRDLRGEGDRGVKRAFEGEDEMEDEDSKKRRLEEDDDRSSD